MPSTTHYKRGDVVLVPFPFTDLSSSKQRPAVVVSPDIFNGTHDDIVVVAITSQIPPVTAPDELLIAQNDLSACGLPKSSIIKSGKMVTLHQRLIIKRIGALPQPVLQKLLGQIGSFFQV